MTKAITFAVLLFIWSVIAPRWSRAQELEAILNPTQGNMVMGTVTFTESNGKVHVVANVTGLKAGKHGFHIHEKGDCSAPDAASAGGHFNPTTKAHGAPEAAEHHIGDLGNLEADSSGQAKLDRTFDSLTLASGPNSILGKAVVVHGGEDDLKSQPAGNAGPRIACGVIQEKKDDSNDMMDHMNM